MSDHDHDHDHDRGEVARLRDLALHLPYAQPEAMRVEAVRSSLLVAAAASDERPRRRWLLVASGFTAGALAAAAVMLLVVHGSHDRSGEVAIAHADHLASIEGSTAADFERQITRTATTVDEVLHLRAGRVELAVVDLAASNHVRVVTRDAEVEGHGRFEVAAIADALHEVIVKDGTATVRVVGQKVVMLGAGQTWTAKVVTADLEVAPPLTADPRTSEPAPKSAARVSTPVPAVAPAPAPTPEPLPTVTAIPPASAPLAASSPTELEHHFATGMQLLKAGKSSEAAHELGIAAGASGNDALAADARYFEAVALTKAGRKAEGEAALLAFLDHAPHSVRRGRAAVMLGRLIAERGDAAIARSYFESAIHDADPAIVAAASAGLASLPH